MNRTIEISVKDRIAWQTNKAEYICGNGGFSVVFAFDSEGEKIERKTARFVYGEQYTDVDIVDNRCEVPKINGVSIMKVGVYADDWQTVPAVVHCKRSITDETATLAVPTTGAQKQIKLADRTDGKEYTLYVDGGKLMMEET